MTKKALSLEEKKRLDIARRRWFFTLLILGILLVGYIVYLVIRYVVN